MSTSERAWLTLEDAAGSPGMRFELKPGLTLIGGPRGNIPVTESGGDCLHLWSSPPKVVFVGSGVPPRVNGREVQEAELADGDRLEWKSLRAVFGHDDGQAKLVEVALAPSVPVAAPAPAAITPAAASPASIAPASLPPSSLSQVPAGGAFGAGFSPAEAAWRKLRAGMVAELSLCDATVLRRWQDAVMRNEFDADAAAREILASARSDQDVDGRVADRSTRLMRDLMMSPLTKSSMRQVRTAARHGLAFVLVQIMIFLLFLLLVLAGLLVGRARTNTSIDGLLDGVLDTF